MWLNYEAFLDPFVFNCFMDDAQLRYDNETGTYENVEGVYTKVDPPRSINGCDYLGKLTIVMTYYFSPHIFEYVGEIIHSVGSFSFVLV